METSNAKINPSQTSFAFKSKADAAVYWAERGFFVFLVRHTTPDGACSCGNAACKSPGKHPLHTGWQEEATNDPERVAVMWEKHPNANIGGALEVRPHGFGCGQQERKTRRQFLRQLGV